MWSDRTEQDYPPKRGAGPADGIKPSESVGPVVASLAVIGKAMIVRGQITSNENMHIDGQVEGSLDLPAARLTIGSNGRVAANATAREVEVLGTIDGDVDAAKKITIRKGGRLIGDLRTAGIVIEDGAYFRGKIEIVNSEMAAENGAPQPAVKKTIVNA